MDAKDRRLIAALRALPRETPSAGFDAAVLAALEAAPAARLPAWVGPAAAFAASAWSVLLAWGAARAWSAASAARLAALAAEAAARGRLALDLAPLFAPSPVTGVRFAAAAVIAAAVLWTVVGPSVPHLRAIGERK